MSTTTKKTTTMSKMSNQDILMCLILSRRAETSTDKTRLTESWWTVGNQEFVTDSLETMWKESTLNPFTWEATAEGTQTITDLLPLDKATTVTITRFRDDRRISTETTSKSFKVSVKRLKRGSVEWVSKQIKKFTMWIMIDSALLEKSRETTIEKPRRLNTTTTILDRQDTFWLKELTNPKCMMTQIWTILFTQWTWASTQVLKRKDATVHILVKALEESEVLEEDAQEMIEDTTKRLSPCISKREGEVQGERAAQTEEDLQRSREEKAAAVVTHSKI